MTNKNRRTKTGIHTKTKTKTLNIVDEKKLSTILMTLSLTKTKTLGVIERFSDYDNPLKNVIFNRTFENPLSKGGVLLHVCKPFKKSGLFIALLTT